MLGTRLLSARIFTLRSGTSGAKYSQPTRARAALRGESEVSVSSHAANSWSEFFVHIATIVLGLLIAVGLEQTVEYFHHRHLAGEARAGIQKELVRDASLLHQNQDRLLADQQSLEKDLVLLDSSDIPDAQTLGGLQYSWRLFQIVDAAWSAAKIDGSIALIPSKQIEAANYFIPPTS